MPAPLCFTPFGIGVGVTHSEEIESDEEADEFTSVGVNYGTGAATRVNSGTVCPSDGFTISANAALVEGWTQMTWTQTKTGLAIGERWIDGPVFSVVFNGP